MSWCCLLHQDIALSHENQIVICHGTSQYIRGFSCFDKLSNRSMVPLKYVLCTMTMHYALCTMHYDVIEILGYPNKSRGPLF